MTNNDILRRFRYAVDLSDAVIIEIFSLVDVSLGTKLLHGYLRREDEAGYLELTPALLNKFLDGLIIYTRGPSAESAPLADKPTRSNNEILKKIRIALQLRDTDMQDIFAAANFKISKAELSALFRKKGHKNYKECGDQILRNFLTGLTRHNRQ